MKYVKSTKMRVTVALCLIAVMIYLQAAEAVRKLPFNGSMFGKRGNVEYDTTGRALSALCEIAAETCQALYQPYEK